MAQGAFSVIVWPHWYVCTTRVHMLARIGETQASSGRDTAWTVAQTVSQAIVDAARSTAGGGVGGGARGGPQQRQDNGVWRGGGVPVLELEREKCHLGLEHAGWVAGYLAQEKKQKPSIRRWVTALTAPPNRRVYSDSLPLSHAHAERPVQRSAKRRRRVPLVMELDAGRTSMGHPRSYALRRGTSFDENWRTETLSSSDFTESGLEHVPPTVPTPASGPNFQASSERSTACLRIRRERAARVTGARKSLSGMQQRTEDRVVVSPRALHAGSRRWCPVSFCITSLNCSKGAAWTRTALAHLQPSSFGPASIEDLDTCRTKFRSERNCPLKVDDDSSRNIVERGCANTHGDRRWD
ncbi:hypothetical protein CC80DRAFT_505558 [Byssothecium circinans]|uniref:Uncharacterized protein n=1 Tax=Byssothecium circinans TaxID=147558 RepID=A0A6A5U1Z6_9PLEO|nr:hypothetical protein CC80DRAFT_505558 [Byssothecium circinans]